MGEAQRIGVRSPIDHLPGDDLGATLAGIGVTIGQVGLWLYARTEGGVLPLIDYLGLTFGALVPLQLLLAAGVAWWRAR